jgi:hypothetical protein
MPPFVLFTNGSVVSSFSHFDLTPHGSSTVAAFFLDKRKRRAFCQREIKSFEPLVPWNAANADDAHVQRAPLSIRKQGAKNGCFSSTYKHIF